MKKYIERRQGRFERYTTPLEDEVLASVTGGCDKNLPTA